jgi:hypothetical protein
MDLLALELAVSENPSQGDSENNANVNAIIENWATGWDDTTVEDVLDVIESQGLSVDKYVKTAIEAMEFSQLSSGLIIPSHI